MLGRVSLEGRFLLSRTALVSIAVHSSVAYAESDLAPGPCGDRRWLGAEECDDGNSADGDGCSARCEREFGFFCEGEPSECVESFGNYGSVGYRGLVLTNFGDYSLGYGEIPGDYVYFVGKLLALSWGWSFWDFDVARLNLGLGLGWVFEGFGFHLSALVGGWEERNGEGTDAHFDLSPKSWGTQVYIGGDDFALLLKLLPGATGQRKGLLTTRLRWDPFEFWSYSYWRERYIGWRTPENSSGLVRGEWIESFEYLRFDRLALSAGQTIFLSPEGIDEITYFEAGIAGEPSESFTLAGSSWLGLLGLAFEGFEKLGVTASFIYPIILAREVMIDFRGRGGYVFEARKLIIDANIQVIASF
ncbi:MAG: hypothetical protein HY791_13415 [Deltaproteobacteria bacterium]|nr:hypothetical protein [Deltaproteobacteria bacterium]